MVELREQLGLALEARQSLGVGGEGRGQELQRDVAVQLAVGRAPDLTHASRAERRDDPVVGERVACRGHHDLSCGRGV